MDRESSPAFAVLRASSKRLLLFIEGEIARQGGGLSRSAWTSFRSSAHAMR
jgi:hypothetical protein